MNKSTAIPPQSISGLDFFGKPAQLEVKALFWRVGVYALIQNDAGQILVLDNIENGALDLPGGGMEVWESIPETCVREVWEETGLKVEFAGVIGADDRFFLSPSGKHMHTVNIFCRARVVGGSLRESIIEGEASVNPHWQDPKTIDPKRFQVGNAFLAAVLGIPYTADDGKSS